MLWEGKWPVPGHPAIKAELSLEPGFLNLPRSSYPSSWHLSWRPLCPFVTNVLELYFCDEVKCRTGLHPEDLILLVYRRHSV